MKRGKPLPQRAQIALVAAGGLVLIALGYLVLLGPKQKHVASLKEQTSAAQAQVADDLARAAEASGGGSNVPTIKVADIYKLTTAMPSVPDMPDLLIELDQTAKASGVTLQSISFGAPAVSTDGTYSSIPISVSATGNFYTLTDLVYRLRNLVYVRDGALQANGRIFSIDSLSLTPGGKNLSASIAINTYIYGSTASATDGTTSTLPTTTDTTTTTTTPAPTSSATAAGATG